MVQYFDFVVDFRVMEEIVKKFDTTCKFISCVSKNESEYEIDLRTKVNSPDYNEQCMQWISKFSAATNTQWIVSQNYANLQSLHYRKDFVCHHNKKNKGRKNESTRERNKKCPEKIIYRVKKTNRFTKYRDPLLKENLNGVIEKYVKFLPMVTLILLYILYPIYFEEIGVKISIQEDPFCCVLLTPLMQRAHNMRFSSEVVFVDSSGSWDQGGSSVTFLFGDSKIGGVPLGCIIHNFRTDEVYNLGFKQFRDLIGTDGFYGKGFPVIFMTDDGVQPRGTH